MCIQHTLTADLVTQNKAVRGGSHILPCTAAQAGIGCHALRHTMMATATCRDQTSHLARQLPGTWQLQPHICVPPSPEDGAGHLICSPCAHPALPAGLHQAIHRAHSQQVAVAQSIKLMRHILLGRAQGRVNVSSIPGQAAAAAAAGVRAGSSLGSTYQGSLRKGELAMPYDMQGKRCQLATLAACHLRHCCVQSILNFNTE